MGAASYDAFISHASADTARAQEICAHLEAAGLRCWIAPRDVRPGPPFGEQIIEGLGRSRCLVLVLSGASNLSEFVHRELERAVSRGKPIYPVRIEEVLPSPRLEIFVSAHQWVDAWTDRRDEQLDRLVATLADGTAEPGGQGRAHDRGDPAAEVAAAARGRTPSRPAGATALAVLVLVALAALAGWWFGGEDDEPAGVDPGGATVGRAADAARADGSPEADGGQALPPVGPGTGEATLDVSDDASLEVAAGDAALQEPGLQGVPSGGTTGPAISAPGQPPPAWSEVEPGVVASEGLWWRTEALSGSHVEAERTVLELNRSLAQDAPRWRLPSLSELSRLAALIDAGAVDRAPGDLIWSDQTQAVLGRVLVYQPGGASTDRRLPLAQSAHAHLVRRAP